MPVSRHSIYFLAYFIHKMGNILMLAEADEREERRRSPAINRHLIRNNIDAFNLRDTLFVSAFRLNKAAVHFIITGIGPALQPTGGPRSKFIPVPNRVLCALYFLANGSYQGAVGNNILSCMSQASVSRFIQKVTKALVQWGKRFVKFPAVEEERAAIRQTFEAKFGLPGIVGCVDGTHIAITTPPGREDAFVNRKGYHSINAQIVCDYDLRIINVVAKYPGSSHDSFVWRNSRVAGIMAGNYANGDTESKLLGDSGYPLLPWLLTPYSNPQPETYEASYNDLHASARNCVERCIGLLKGRFRCLLRDRTLHYGPQAACRIIMACVVLHNLCGMFNVDQVPCLYDDLDLEPPQEAAPLPEYRALRNVAQQLRDEYARTLFS